jgi:DNA-binding XRE family transcriptional regulator
MNPIKEIREGAHLSQREAASIAGITEQVVLKAEHGMYPTLPPSILKAFASISGEEANTIEYRYEKWIDEELRKIKLPSSVDIAHPSEFLHFRSVVTKLNGVPDTTNSFCKLFKMNPYVIQKFEGGRLKQTPLQLVERIAYIKGEF